MDEPGLINFIPLVHIGNKGCNAASFRWRIKIQFLSLVTRTHTTTATTATDIRVNILDLKKKKKKLTARVAHADGRKHTFRDVVMIGWPSHCPPG